MQAIELYETYNTSIICDIRKFQILILAHYFFHHRTKLPTILKSYFNINNSFYHHNIRESNSLQYHNWPKVY